MKNDGRRIVLPLSQGGHAESMLMNADMVVALTWVPHCLCLLGRFPSNERTAPAAIREGSRALEITAICTLDDLGADEIIRDKRRAAQILSTTSPNRWRTALWTRAGRRLARHGCGSRRLSISLMHSSFEADPDHWQPIKRFSPSCMLRKQIRVADALYS